MKMIASTKLAKAQRAMQAGKNYGLANKGMMEALYALRSLSFLMCRNNRGV